MLIVFEGLDGTGKTTQTNLLKEYFKDKMHLMKFPNRTTEIGKLINDFLQKKIHYDEKTIQLLFAANKYENQQEIIENINNNKIVVLDRYILSSMAYSSDIDWVKELNKYLLQPNITIFMNRQIEIKNEEIYENKLYQQKTYENFMKLIDNSYIINSDKAAEEINKEIIDLILKIDYKK